MFSHSSLYLSKEFVSILEEKRKTKIYFISTYLCTHPTGPKFPIRSSSCFTALSLFIFLCQIINHVTKFHNEECIFMLYNEFSSLP